MRLATAKAPSTTTTALWLFEWDLASASPGDPLYPARSIKLSDIDADTGSVWRLLDSTHVSLWRPTSKELEIATILPGGGLSCDVMARSGLDVLPAAGGAPVFSRSGSCFVAGGAKGGIWRGIGRNGPPAGSKAWKELFTGQVCELEFPSSKVFVSDEGHQVVRVAYFWRYDESGTADEYSMPIIYDTATDKVREQILRIGERARVNDLAWIDGRIWVAATVERMGKKWEQAVTDLERKTTYTVIPKERPEEPMLWDLEGQRLVRIEAPPSTALPSRTAVELHDYRNDRMLSCSLVYGAN